MRENQENWAMNLVELEMEMSNRNDVTGDKIISKKNNQSFEDNFDNIFRKRKAELDEKLAEEEAKDYEENGDGKV
jgi:hypothetical protein